MKAVKSVKDARAYKSLQQRVDHIASRLPVVANAYRRLIHSELAKGEGSWACFSRPSALSQQLTKLRECSKVATRRESQSIRYCIDDPDLELLMAAPYGIRPVSARFQAFS
ncbi:hypothetical protein EYC08_17345, partial [Tabrizicola sp. WMC-M-20]